LSFLTISKWIPLGAAEAPISAALRAAAKRFHSLKAGNAGHFGDRLAGMSLTDVAKKYGISRASVVRVVRDAKQRQVVEAA